MIACRLLHTCPLNVLLRLLIACLTCAGAKIQVHDACKIHTTGGEIFCTPLSLQSPQPSEETKEIATASGEYKCLIRKWASREKGQGESESPPLVFLHGFLGDPADWDPLAAPLSLDTDCYAIGFPLYIHSSSASDSALPDTGRPDH